MPNKNLLGLAVRTDRQRVVDFVQQAGRRYWPDGAVPADPHPGRVCDLSVLGRSWTDVDLPDQYTHLGVRGQLVVDEACLTDGEGPAFDRCDWYLAAFCHLSGIAEQRHEARYGPVHSFASRLPSIPSRCFDHAWANRILLLLRQAEADRRQADANHLFGPLPRPQIILTHDIDALDKTGPIRLKQSFFELFNTLRFATKADFRGAKEAFLRGLRMLFATPRYDHLDQMADLVRNAGLRSVFHVHAREKRRPLKLWLMDPGYHADDPRLVDFVGRRVAEGFSFGLHPSYDSWGNPALIRRERDHLGSSLHIEVFRARQHWLRFSWFKTWRAQAEAGLTSDSTLGFNDRAGFRTASAVQYQPWLLDAGVLPIQVTPMILMDSHLYSYRSLTDESRRGAIRSLLDEVRAVHGVACVLWHPHTLSDDYDWRSGFDELLHTLSGWGA